MIYFTFKELCYSATANSRGIDNSAPEGVRVCLEALVDAILDPLRRAWGGPIVVTSGYRCPELNRAVGGAVASQHMKGEAADITVGSRVRNKQLYNMLLNLRLPFDQLIWEKGDATGPDWIHVSLKRNGGNRYQRLWL